MLVLSRKQREQIQIGDNVVLTILRVKGNTVRIGIEAPRDVRVVRGELPPETVEVNEAEVNVRGSNRSDESNEEIANLNLGQVAVFSSDPSRNEVHELQVELEESERMQSLHNRLESAAGRRALSGRSTNGHLSNNGVRGRQIGTDEPASKSNVEVNRIAKILASKSDSELNRLQQLVHAMRQEHDTESAH